jgi:hypothetical protein
MYWEAPPGQGSTMTTYTRSGLNACPVWLQVTEQPLERSEMHITIQLTLKQGLFALLID